MKRLAALVVAVAFALGSAGLAQAQAPAPAEKKAGEAKMEKKAKQAPAKNANGTVKSATADSVVVTGKEKVKGSKETKDVEWTFAVDPKTAIKKGGKAITAGDLMAGDPLPVRHPGAEGQGTPPARPVKGAGQGKAAKEPRRGEGEEVAPRPSRAPAYRPASGTRTSSIPVNHTVRSVSSTVSVRPRSTGSPRSHTDTAE